jgi:arylsulfatase B
MSNYFKDAGYKTHLVGKWHLGYYSERYTPTYRGFDSFYGYYNGLIDYYNYTYVEGRDFTPGYDFRKNEDTYYGMEHGSYATDLFNDEAVNIIKNHDDKNPLFLMLNSLAPHTGNDYQLLQAPQKEIDKFSYIEDKNRRVLAGKIRSKLKIDYS